MQQVTAQFVHALDDQRVRCQLCPHHCTLAPGDTGICRVRTNVDGHVELPFYGRASALSVDPIEKKPLYHFHPGSRILSVGFLGCNLRCPFCQNYQISQRSDIHTDYVSPGSLTSEAQRLGSIGVAYTYNEPTIHYEYVEQAAEVAHAAGLKSVLVTAGFLERAPARRLLPRIDAANIDLKGFTHEFYRDEIQGQLPPVKRFIELALEYCHVEVTTLLVPGRNDSPEEVQQIAAYLASLSPDIPLHLSAYHPSYRYSTAATPAELVADRVAVARRHLRYVYAGNTVADGSTYCPSCGVAVVQRRGYTVRVTGLRDGCCSSCGEPIPIAY
jgi:pyruvate formate lyase activating enzyme